LPQAVNTEQLLDQLKDADKGFPDLVEAKDFLNSF
jgi:hypothetical protein